MASQTFTTTQSWEAPANVYRVSAEARAGGGGGSTNGSSAARPGGGGGGGARAYKAVINVTPTQNYTVTVGAAVSAETAGNPSSFVGDNSETVSAAGGSATTNRTGAAGGTVAASVGDANQVFAGGAGGTAANTNNHGGAGGGEGAATTATGNAGSANSTSTGGAGGTGTDGGDGGKGGDNEAAGSDGTAPGGGGGGAGGNNNTGGGGARGDVTLTWTVSTAPDAPTSLAASAISSSRIDLTWVAPASNGGEPITNYKVYRNTASPATTLIDTLGDVLSYSDTSVSADTTYYYRVKATNIVGDSAFSNEDNATTPSAGGGGGRTAAGSRNSSDSRGTATSRTAADSRGLV
jgi:hypothetical protein